MATTPFAYHNDEANHGNYQFVTLKTIVNNFYKRMQDDDHILKNKRRYLIVDYAKEAISKLNKELKNDVLAAEITVSPDKLYFNLPHDFIDYARVSLVVPDQATNSYRLQPLDVNPNINIADGYLQDHEYNILFDEDGYILMADSSNAYNKPYKKYEFTSGCSNPTADTSKYSKYGEFKIDKRRGKIVFSSDLADKEIVIEYISDGLSPDTYNEGDIKVSKYLEQPVKDWIFFAGIEHAKNINQSEKNRALLRYKTTLHQAKLDLSGLDLLSISKAMRISTKNK
ncbi:hypothetical protein [Thalassobellus suaedae]|uniref:Uncharacterized protein n=1 Tax=Thalassobellus suaedae TaxID=3074124 RepID=A0ABY9XVV1_9FLAO|nr:hypothetical protein RHP51_04900 [Flavobacteriaceae bacterium HL-DH14]